MADVPYNTAMMILVIPLLLASVDQIGRSAPLVKMLPKRAGSGKNISERIKTGGIVVTNTPEGDPAPDASVNAQARYTFDWATYDSAITETELARRASGTVSAPPDGTGDYTALEIDEMTTHLLEMCVDVERDLWGASGANEIVSLYDALGDDTNTYGGIDRSLVGNTYWRPRVFDDGVPTTPTIGLVKADLVAIQTGPFKPGKPDLVVVSPNVFEAIKTSMGSQITHNVTAGPAQAEQRVEIQADVEKIKIGQATIFPDEYAPDTEITYINSRYARLEYLPYPKKALDMLKAMLRPGYMEAIQQRLLAAGMNGAFLLFDALIKTLGATGAHDKIMAQFYLQLVIDRPNSGGMRLNISV